MKGKNTLTHPATVFIQSLDYRAVAYKDMNPYHQIALFHFMFCDGDGVWASYCSNVNEAVAVFGDVKFGVGRFNNDDTMKVAFVEATDGADTENPLEWFDENCVCFDAHAERYPVILNPADVAPDFGLFEWGYENFYNYWAARPQTEFIRFLPGWDAEDPSGRGGQ